MLHFLLNEEEIIYENESIFAAGTGYLCNHNHNWDGTLGADADGQRQFKFL